MSNTKEIWIKLYFRIDNNKSHFEIQNQISAIYQFAKQEDIELYIDNDINNSGCLCVAIGPYFDIPESDIIAMGEEFEEIFHCDVGIAWR